MSEEEIIDIIEFLNEKGYLKMKVSTPKLLATMYLSSDRANVKNLGAADVNGSLLLGLDNPFPLVDVLSQLKWATEYLLHKKDYDGHNHEELNQCVRRAKEIVEHLGGSNYDHLPQVF